MNIKDKKGITIIALVVSIIIMLILVGIAVRFGEEAVTKANLEDIKADMFSIKTKAKIIVDKYNFKDIENLVGTKYLETAEYNKEMIDSILPEEQKQNSYILTQEDLNNNGLNTIKVDLDSFYVVYYNLEESNSCEVYYSKGYEGKFSLSELKDM